MVARFRMGRKYRLPRIGGEVAVSALRGARPSHQPANAANHERASNDSSWHRGARVVRHLPRRHRSSTSRCPRSGGTGRRHHDPAVGGRRVPHHARLADPGGGIDQRRLRAKLMLRIGLIAFGIASARDRRGAESRDADHRAARCRASRARCWCRARSLSSPRPSGRGAGQGDRHLDGHDQLGHDRRPAARRAVRRPAVVALGVRDQRRADRDHPLPADVHRAPRHPSARRLDRLAGRRALHARARRRVYALIEQRNLGWTAPAIWILLLAGIALFAGFLVRQRFAKEPIMPLGCSGCATSGRATSRRCSSTVHSP